MSTILQYLKSKLNNVIAEATWNSVHHANLVDSGAWEGLIPQGGIESWRLAAGCGHHKSMSPVNQANSHDNL